VDLRGSFSNPRKSLRSLIPRVLRGSRARRPRTRDGRITDQRGPVRENSRQSQTRLSVSSRADLLVGYASGVPVRELAAQFKVHRSTVREIARQTGLAARQPELPDTIRQGAARLYADGLPLAHVVTQLGISIEVFGRRWLRAVARSVLTVAVVSTPEDADCFTVPRRSMGRDALAVPGHHVGASRVIGGWPPRAEWRRPVL